MNLPARVKANRQRTKLLSFISLLSRLPLEGDAHFWVGLLILISWSGKFLTKVPSSLLINSRLSQAGNPCQATQALGISKERQSHWSYFIRNDHCFIIFIIALTISIIVCQQLRAVVCKLAFLFKDLQVLTSSLFYGFTVWMGPPGWYFCYSQMNLHMSLQSADSPWTTHLPGIWLALAGFILEWLS